MNRDLRSVITGTGSYLPDRKVSNEDFLQQEFYEASGQKVSKSNQYIIDKFFEITTIQERRYVNEEQVTSDIAFLASKEAIKNAKIDPETLDYIIVAHNFGDVGHNSNRSDMVPTLASRVKYKLKIKNPDCVAYDLPFGCPGWLQAVIHADYFIKSGDAKKVLVVGAETISRVIDPHDRDSMLYADGAAATILEAAEGTDRGLLKHKTRSDTYEYSKMLSMGASYNQQNGHVNDLYLKMNGRRLYQYALETVPQAIKSSLEKSGIDIHEVKKILIHQANGKMDDAILKRLYSLYGITEIPKDIMPMIIAWTGNSSVATIPTLLDLILRNEIPEHHIEEGDVIVFASVGAGMNINAAVYRF